MPQEYFHLTYFFTAHKIDFGLLYCNFHFKITSRRLCVENGYLFMYVKSVFILSVSVYVNFKSLKEFIFPVICVSLRLHEYHLYRLFGSCLIYIKLKLIILTKRYIDAILNAYILKDSSSVNVSPCLSCVAVMSWIVNTMYSLVCTF